jgi:hypothetical protein
MVGRLEEGVMSIGSRGGVKCDELVEEGRMGIDLWIPWWCGSAEKGLRRASATDAISVLVERRVGRCGCCSSGGLLGELCEGDWRRTPICRSGNGSRLGCF